MTQTFEDFYTLLEVAVSATPEEIRRAFRARMREWHPDVNPSPDATAHTQRLIVAYKILNDPDARTRYDIEYARHCRTASSREGANTSAASGAQRGTAPSQTTPDFSDPVLERWIRTARKEAAEEWRQFASEFKGASMAALGAAARGILLMIILSIIGFVVLYIL